MAEFIIASWAIIIVLVGFKFVEAAFYENSYRANDQEDIWVGDHF